MKRGPKNICEVKDVLSCLRVGKRLLFDCRENIGFLSCRKQWRLQKAKKYCKPTGQHGPIVFEFRKRSRVRGRARRVTRWPRWRRSALGGLTCGGCGCRHKL